MAQQKKMVEAITSMEEDFAQWYTDVVKKAEMIDYSSVKGCMVSVSYTHLPFAVFPGTLRRAAGNHERRRA